MENMRRIAVSRPGAIRPTSPFYVGGCNFPRLPIGKPWLFLEANLAVP
jgi:hypothetical protein